MVSRFRCRPSASARCCRRARRSRGARPRSPGGAPRTREHHRPHVVDGVPAREQIHDLPVHRPPAGVLFHRPSVDEPRIHGRPQGRHPHIGVEGAPRVHPRGRDLERGDVSERGGRSAAPNDRAEPSTASRGMRVIEASFGEDVGRCGRFHTRDTTTPGRRASGGSREGAHRPHGASRSVRAGHGAHRPECSAASPGPTRGPDAAAGLSCRPAGPVVAHRPCRVPSPG